LKGLGERCRGKENDREWIKLKYIAIRRNAKAVEWLGMGGKVREYKNRS
jgi:hypothetical protein